MIEGTLKLTAKVDEKTGEFFIPNETSIETVEKMCLQFLQILGQIKIQQQAAAAAQQAALETPAPEIKEG